MLATDRLEEHQCSVQFFAMKVSMDTLHAIHKLRMDMPIPVPNKIYEDNMAVIHNLKARVNT